MSSLPPLLLVSIAALLQPAPSRSLEGIVEDPSGGAIVNAAVTVVCDDTVRATVTDSSGRFAFDDLPAAPCRAEAQSPYFMLQVVEIDLTTRRSGFVRLVLPIATVQTEVVVTPARGERERAFDVPEPVAVATREELESRPYQILPQTLREEPGVLVQQTSTAQGSPFIRGFSAQRILYVFDGVRFNTSTFRAGATQYLGWINPALVESIEVVRGPGSVQYGSDSLGGTINVRMQPPALASGPGTRVSGQVEGVLGSADLSGGGGVTVAVQTPTVGVRVGSSARRVGELRAGGGEDSHSVVTRFLGLPSRDVYTRLPDTDFGQAGAFVSLNARLGGSGRLSGVYLHEEQFDSRRYDRLLGGDGRFRSDFTPQRLDFGYLRYERDAIGPLGSLQATFSVNRQQDDRNEQARRTSPIERDNEHVLALGYQSQASRLVAGRHAVTFGGEVYDEYIGGERFFEDPGTSVRTPERPGIPDGTRYTSTGLFVQDSTEILSGRVGLRGGLRYGRFVFSTREDAALDVRRQRVVSDAVTFHTGAVWRLTPWLNATGSVGRGFRAANAFDLGSIGVSGGGFEIAPADARALGAFIGSDDGATAVSTGRLVGALEPESLLAYEAGLKLLGARVSGSVTVFDLELRDIIQRRVAIFPRPVVGQTIAGFQLVAQDEAGRVFIELDPRPVTTRVNVDRARIRGVEAEGQFRVTPEWIASAYFSVVNGREIESGDFLRRMPPPFGGVRVRWEPSAASYWVEGVLNYARPQTRLSPGDLGDARIGARRTRTSIADFFRNGAVELGLVRDGILVPTGETLAEVQARVLGSANAAPLFTETPGFAVLGLRGGFRLGAHVDITLLLDNLTDTNYRWHGSGVDAPGFNAQVRTRYRF